MKIKNQVALTLIHHLGPITQSEMWDALWGEGSSLYNDRQKSLEVLGFAPGTFDDVLARLRERGYIYAWGRENNRAIRWRAV